MTADVATLQINVDSSGVNQATIRLNILTDAGRRTERATDGVGKSFSNLKGIIVGLTSSFVGLAAVMFIKKVTEVTTEFQKLNAMLTIATGSSANAAEAFKGVQKFAQTTPYDLAQTTTALIKLINYGLDPSAEAMRTWGDMASANGKDLMQLVEAVGDAVVGDFQRMKEGFNVTGKDLGDKIKITFKGVSTTVTKDAASIEAALKKIANDNFAGSMVEQMKTLGGQLSNLGDAWDTMFLVISKEGLGELIGGAVTMASQAITDLTNQIASGALQTQLDALGTLWGQLFKGMSTNVDETGRHVTGEMTVWEKTVQAVGEIFKETFDYIPVNIKATIEIVGHIIYGLVETTRISAETAVRLFANEFDRLVAITEAVKMKIDSILSKAPPINLGAKLDGIDFKFDNRAKKVLEQAKQEWNTALSITTEGVDTALSEREISIAEYEKQMEDARQKLKDFNAEAAKSDGIDPFAKYRIKPQAGGGADTGKGKKKSNGERQLDSLVQQLLSEEDAIQHSYDKRLQIIRDNTEKGGELQTRYSNLLVDKTAKELIETTKLRDDDYETYFNQYGKAEEALRKTYDERKRIILESTKTTEEEKLKLMTEAETKYANDQRKMEVNRQKVTLGLAADFFGNISTIASAFGKKGHKIAMAAAIAQTTIKTIESAQSAYSALAGIPYIGPALGAAAAAAAIAAGAANVAKIKSTPYSGEYADGGMIGAGSYGMVGEAGAEFVRGPAMVTSAKTTRDALASQKTDSKPVTVQIFNLPGQSAEVTEKDGPDGKQMEVVITAVRTRLTGEIIKGTGEFAGAIQNTWKLTRA